MTDRELLKDVTAALTMVRSAMKLLSDQGSLIGVAASAQKRMATDWRLEPLADNVNKIRPKLFEARATLARIEAALRDAKHDR